MSASAAPNNEINGFRSPTIRLNVSGTKYEVERSLLEQYPDTMLARLVSSRWNNIHEEKAKDIEEIFIGRDGARFSYILDYMRDHKVFLPASISKKAIMLDFKYFGFEDLPDDSIDSIDAEKQNEQIVTACLRAHQEMQDYHVLACILHQRMQMELRANPDPGGYGTDLMFHYGDPHYEFISGIFAKYRQYEDAGGLPLAVEPINECLEEFTDKYSCDFGWSPLDLDHFSFHFVPSDDLE